MFGSEKRGVWRRRGRNRDWEVGRIKGGKDGDVVHVCGRRDLAGSLPFADADRSNWWGCVTMESMERDCRH